MFTHQGIYFPDGEKHFPGWMDKNGELVDGRGTYQIKKLRAAMEYCKSFRTAVDVGAHVGLWSIQLQQRFERVEAFEPIPELAECWHRNVGSASNVALHRVALGNTTGIAEMVYDRADTGGTHVHQEIRRGGAISLPTVEIRPLDNFGLRDVDFIKIDCEGYELEVLRGAQATVRTNRPCIIVEQKPHIMSRNFGTKGAPAVEFLLGMGAVLRREMGGDYILSFD